MGAQTHPAEAGLPTLARLGIISKSFLESVDPRAIAEDWVQRFTKATAKPTLDIPSIVNEVLVPSSFQSRFLSPENLLSPNGTIPPPIPGGSDVSVYWRDALALTWDLRTFEGSAKIEKFLTDRLPWANIHNVKLQVGGTDVPPPEVQNIFEDLVWVRLIFTFDTDVGECTAVAKLVPVASDGEFRWKAHTIFTRLERLHSVEVKAGRGRKMDPFHGPWDELRSKENRFEDGEPTVLIIGAGQSGLMTAANLKVQGIDALIIEKTERVGDNWRKRYEALCLHDPVWYDHMSFLPFPKTWPVYTPARKLGNWLEHYADTFDLNVWTSSTVTKAIPTAEGWDVTVVSKSAEGEKTRVFHVKHLIFASGWNGGLPHIPEFAGRDKFRGQVLHSFQHNKATDHQGKKVVVVGAATAAFDICMDYADKGVDVTMYQRGPTYVITSASLRVLLGGLYSEDQRYSVEVSDLLDLSTPFLAISGIAYRAANAVAELDREALTALESKGFQLNRGFYETGIMGLVLTKGGGYYIDVGGSKYISDGRIKLKSKCGSIKEFTENGLKFEDGSELEADVVVLCTGQTDAKKALSPILDQDIIDKCSDIWGLTEEGEIRGCFRELGPRNLWSMMGNLAIARIQSRNVALQIKAKELGVLKEGDRYKRH